MGDKDKMYLDALISEFSRISAAYDSLLTKISITATMSGFLIFETYEYLVVSKTVIFCIIAFCFYVVALFISLYLLLSKTLKAPCLEGIDRNGSEEEYLQNMIDTYAECIRVISEQKKQRHKVYNMAIWCIMGGVFFSTICFCMKGVS